MARTKRITRQVLLTTIDAAGRTLMGFGADATLVMDVPAWALSCEEAFVVYTQDGVALGSAVGFAIIEGDASKDGRQELPCGGGGSEDVDAMHSSRAASVLTNLGIRIIGNQNLEVRGQIVGEDPGNATLSCTLVFSDEPVQVAMKWKGFEAQATVLNTFVQGATLDGTTSTIPNPGVSVEIGGLLSTHGLDFATLGAGGHGNIRLTDGVKDEQNWVCGGGGGENVTAAGDINKVTQEINTRIPLDTVGANIRVDVRTVGELSGTQTIAGSLGFVL